jgi:hypothetical protein
MKMKANCCKDEHKHIQTDKNQKPSQAAFEFSKPFTDLATLNYTSVHAFGLSSITTDHPTANAPPLINKGPIFLLNRNFRI